MHNYANEVFFSFAVMRAVIGLQSRRHISDSTCTSATVERHHCREFCTQNNEYRKYCTSEKKFSKAQIPFDSTRHDLSRRIVSSSYPNMPDACSFPFYLLF